MKNKHGFTLAELLITVAIIGVLVGISIPVFTSQLEKAKRVVDMSNMRNAYAALMTGITTGEKEIGHTYFYDASTSSLVDSRPAGYGKAGTESSAWWKGVGTSNGVPRNKALLIQMDEFGTVTYKWGGAYAGLNVTNKTQYNALSQKEKLDHDVVLLDSLQSEFRNMTYGELRDLFFDGNNVKSEFNRNSYTGGSNQALVQSLHINNKDYMCVTIAESTIIDGSVDTNGEKHNNKVYLPEVFENTGYTVSANTSKNYIINSVSGSKTGDTGNSARLWVNLGITKNELKILTSDNPIWNEKATGAYTYIKGAGTTTDPSISESARRLL